MSSDADRPTSKHTFLRSCLTAVRRRVALNCCRSQTAIEGRALRALLGLCLLAIVSMLMIIGTVVVAVNVSYFGRTFPKASLRFKGVLVFSAGGDWYGGLSFALWPRLNDLSLSYSVLYT